MLGSRGFTRPMVRTGGRLRPPEPRRLQRPAAAADRRRARSGDPGLQRHGSQAGGPPAHARIAAAGHRGPAEPPAAGRALPAGAGHCRHSASTATKPAATITIILRSRKIRSGAAAVVVGDVSGHGAQAALLMASARAALRLRASLPGSLAEIVADVNRQFTIGCEATAAPS
ncbi:MAG: serine/threonine-protein phosphatase [Desulfobacterales bacterium]|nr:serine/threonine-protein phosphatase [Desulfobacterales bacterium]